MNRAPSKDFTVLWSGGMDSTVSLYWALNQARYIGLRVHALTIAYGQRHAQEVNQANLMWRKLQNDDRYRAHLGEHVVHRLYFPYTPGSLIGGDEVMHYDDATDAEARGKEDNSFIPYRNLVFLSVAATYAYRWNGPTIVTGLRGGWADCTEQFERMFGALANQCVPQFSLRFQTPTHVSRHETLQLAATIDGCLDALSHTLTCFEGKKIPCGTCLPCRKRAEGFEAAGVPDPLLTVR